MLGTDTRQAVVGTLGNLSFGKGYAGAEVHVEVLGVQALSPLEDSAIKKQRLFLVILMFFRTFAAANAILRLQSIFWRGARVVEEARLESV